MNRHSGCDTRELSSTGEQLLQHRGFTGMGRSELLKTAEVPRGSFYHYFRFWKPSASRCLNITTPDICSAWSTTSIMATVTIAIACWPTISTLNQFCQQGIISGVLLSSYPRRFAICRKICAPPWIAEPADYRPAGRRAGERTSGRQSRI